MTFWLWDTTAANNDDADTTVNLRENQAPSTLNNAVRALMATLAKWRDSTSGVKQTGGSGTAYTLTTGASIALADGVTVSFRLTATNGGSPTLNVDGTGAVALHTASITPPRIGTLVVGSIHTATYHAGTNGWVLHGGHGLPAKYIGEVFDWAGPTEPAGSVFCYGQALSREAYAALFDAIGTTYGAGDGSTTFNVPDLRGRVVAGQDDMGGSSANRLTSPINGDTLGAAGGSESHTLTEGQLPGHTHVVSLSTDENGAHIHFTLGETNFGNPAGGDHWSTGSESPIAQQGVGGGDDRQYNLAPSASGATTGGTSGNGAHTHSVIGATAATGSGAAHNNVQPTLILNKCIFAGVYT
jgi:microcystin-dependent protein